MMIVGLVQIWFHQDIETHEPLASVESVQKLCVKSRIRFPSTFIARISMLCFGVTYKIVEAG